MLIRNGKLIQNWVIQKVKMYKTESFKKGEDKGSDDKDKMDSEKIALVGKASTHTLFESLHIGGDERNAMDKNIHEAQHPALTNVTCLMERPPNCLKGGHTEYFFEGRRRIYTTSTYLYPHGKCKNRVEECALSLVGNGS